jgi:hypothetical protein
MFFVYFLVGALGLYLIWQVLRWFAEADPKQLVRGGQWALAGIGGAVALWLIVTGKAADALVLMTTMVPFFVRWKGLWTRMRNASGPTPGGSSDVETAWLRMSLDHESGTMDGVVLQGTFRGRRLGELSADELRDLLVAARADGDTATLLETYLDRRYPDWRQSAATDASSQSPSAAMTPEEAWRVLGLEPGADEAAIRDAHRRLMKKVHPDQGGSTYLAAKINQAKDLLLGG